MARKDPVKVAEKWRKRLSGSTQEIRDGVNAVTEAPGKKAAAAQDKMLARLTARVEDGTWARRVAGVSVEDWRDAMLNKGVARISTGAEAAEGKVAEFHAELGVHQESIDADLAKMPSVSLEDNISRAEHQIRKMSKFRKS